MRRRNTDPPATSEKRERWHWIAVDQEGQLRKGRRATLESVVRAVAPFRVWAYSTSRPALRSREEGLQMIAAVWCLQVTRELLPKDPDAPAVTARAQLLLAPPLEVTPHGPGMVKVDLSPIIQPIGGYGGKG